MRNVFTTSPRSRNAHRGDLLCPLCVRMPKCSDNQGVSKNACCQDAAGIMCKLLSVSGMAARCAMPSTGTLHRVSR